MLTAEGSGASQKVRNQWRGESRVTQTPCTVRGCYAASDKTFVALKRPSKERPLEVTGQEAKWHALVGTGIPPSTAASQPGSLF